MQPSGELARLRDVARAANVSQGTASNVFNRPELVRAEVREHVRAIARELGYKGPDPRGRVLRAGKVNALGIATTRPLSYFFDDPFARTLMQSISAACDAAGVGMSLISARDTDQLAWNISSAVVDGLVLLCVDGGEPLIALARERQLPSVSVALADPSQPVLTVGIDDRGAAALATRYLASLGHRRFGILSLRLDGGAPGPASVEAAERSGRWTGRERIRGYLDGLAGLPEAARSVRIFQVQSQRSDVEAGLAYLFGDHAGLCPTALVCMSDGMALAALQWLRARGIAVPRQVSVFGFDGVPEAAQSEPSLTTIAQPLDEMGRRAIQFVLQPPEQPQLSLLPVELVVGASTAPPPR